MRKFCRKCGRGFNAPQEAPDLCPKCLLEEYYNHYRKKDKKKKKNENMETSNKV